MKELLVVSASPHIHSRASTNRAMSTVIIALAPAFFYSIFIFGWHALLLCVLSVVASVGIEALAQRLLGRKVTITDGSAFITGILLAFSLPPGVPFWIPIAGSIFAIVVVKQLFGGLGHNFINPALAGRAFLMASWPSLLMTRWLAPFGGTLSGMDSITGATPLSLLKNPANYGNPDFIFTQLNTSSMIKNLFIGKIGGSIGETSALLLLIGGLFLMVTGIVDFRIVTSFLGSFALFVLVLPTKGNILFHFFSGGLLLGAFFMATDWVTTPVTKKGRWIFGTGCGIITAIIRQWGSYPEGVSSAILLMNILTPLIDQLTRERVFGAVSTKLQGKEVIK